MRRLMHCTLRPTKQLAHDNYQLVVAKPRHGIDFPQALLKEAVLAYLVCPRVSCYTIPSGMVLNKVR